MNSFKKFLYYIYHFVNIKENKKKQSISKKIDKFFNSDINSNAFKDGSQTWKDIFNMCLKQPLWEYELDNFSEMFEGFSNEKIKLIKRAKSCDDFSAPVVVCVQRNNQTYLNEFLPYYRNLGVKHFIFIDNNSNDSSYNFLLDQDDVTLYESKYPYSGRKKCGWSLQAIAENGLNHWYLWLDSDEFIVYPNIESVKLNEYIKILDANNIKNFGGFMLDMYPNGCIMSSSDDNLFYKDYRYFDKNSDYYKFAGDNLFGGMRNRVLGLDNIRLDKTPLVYCDKSNIPVGSHDTLPKRFDLVNNFGCVLKHYKFLPSSGNKFKANAKDTNNGYQNQLAQQKYVDLINKDLMYEGSVEFIDSSSLNVFPYVKDMVGAKK